MFSTVLEQIAADLRDAGVSAAVDPRDLNLPGVLVRMDAVVPGSGKLCGTETLEFSLLLVVPEIGETGAYYTLDALYAATCSALDVNLTNDRRPLGTTVLPGSPTGLPCLQMTGTALYDPAAPQPATTGGNTHGYVH